MRRCRVWVARQGGRVVGFLALDGDDLAPLYLPPGDYRQGIGSPYRCQAEVPRHRAWESLCGDRQRTERRDQAQERAGSFRALRGHCSGP